MTTVPAPVQRDLPDLVKRRWDRSEPDRVWVADLTYVPSSEGTVYTGVTPFRWTVARSAIVLSRRSVHAEGAAALSA